MKTNFLKYLVGLSGLLFSVCLSAQQLRSIIPYDIVGDKMVIEMIVNDSPRRFIFDTGGRTSVTREFAREMGLEKVDSIEVTDANGRKSYYPLVKIELWSTLDQKVRFSDYQALLIPEESLACFQVEGIIGSDLLSGAILEIDGKKKRITISSAENYPGASLRQMQPFVQNGYMPIIPLQIGMITEIAALFDTGYGGFLSLKNTDFRNLSEKGEIGVVSQGIGGGSMGLTGMVFVDTTYRVKIPLLQIGAVKFSNLRAETATPPYSLLGMKLLDHGKVTIDYFRGRFYFEPYRKENNMATKQDNLELMVKDGELLIATVWGDMRGVVEVGDKVVRINGKQLREMDFCESILRGIPELQRRKNTKLTVLTREGEKVVILRKE